MPITNVSAGRLGGLFGLNRTDSGLFGLFGRDRSDPTAVSGIINKIIGEVILYEKIFLTCINSFNF